MTNIQLIEALRRLNPNQPDAMDALADRVVTESRLPARSAVALLVDPDPKMSESAASLLSRIGDLAAVPLLESSDPPDPLQRVWKMQTIVDVHLELRAKIVPLLDKMLADKTQVPWRKMPRVEEAPVSSRICDEAYVLMRRLMNLHEDRAEYLANARAFLRLTNEEKDAEILKAKESRVWSNLAGDRE